MYSGTRKAKSFDVIFQGENNTLTVAEGANIARLSIRFDCNNGSCAIASSSGVSALQASIRVGEDATVKIGRSVSTTNTMQISAVEGSSVSIGDDVMVAGNVKVRGDDGHPIFDVETGQRVNIPEPITIGDHVWLGLDSTILGGAQIGSGSVVGTRALVKGRFPNNCIVAGVPARIIRKNIAWERPHLSMVPPYYKPDASSITRSPYWAITNEVPEEDY